MTDNPGQKAPHFHHLDINDPQVIKVLTENGAIWKTPFAQKGLDAIKSGLVSVAACKDMPANIRAALS